MMPILNACMLSYIVRALVGMWFAVQFGCLAVAPCFAQANSENLDGLTSEALRLYVEGKHGAALVVAKRMNAILEKRLPGYPESAHALTLVGNIYMFNGLFPEAQALALRSLQLREKAVGPEHADVVVGLINLGSSYVVARNFENAESTYLRAIGLSEKLYGPNDPMVAQCLNNLGGLYHTEERFSDAEPLYQRALAIRTRELGANDRVTNSTVRDLASLYEQTRRFDQAEIFAKRYLETAAANSGPNHTDVAHGLGLLAGIFEVTGRRSESEPLYKRALEIFESVYGPDAPYVSMALKNLADLYKSQGKYAESEQLFKRALAGSQKPFGPDHVFTILALSDMAGLYFAQHDYEKALPFAERAAGLFEQHIVGGIGELSAAEEAAKNGEALLRFIGILSRNPAKLPPQQLADRSLRVAQLRQTTRTGVAVAKMAARFAAGNDELASLIKRKQDAEAKFRLTASNLVDAVGTPPGKRDAASEESMRTSAAMLRQEITEFDRELFTRFPEYKELTHPSPVSMDQLQGILHTDEAVLVYAVGSESFLWVVTKDGSEFMRLDVDEKTLGNEISSVRRQLDVDGGALKFVDLKLLHTLYQRLLAPAMSKLAKTKHLVIVPSGPIQNLPFGLLVLSPAPDVRAFGDYRKVDWAVRRYAFSVLPTVSSLNALRRFSRQSAAAEPFSGFGDPLLGPPAGSTREVRVGVDIATVYGHGAARGVARGGRTAVPRRGLVDVDAIRRIPRLPETADELLEISKALGGRPEAVWLGGDATESRVKTTNLSNYRTVAFATHGIMAGDIDGIGEPGLVLTPPRQADANDDGYLSASEIARLKLDADWVILSACNTATSDGTPNAEGLSGLAKAFFFAGARSLFVSYWPVSSAATVSLTTTMLRQYAAHPALGKAEAHRQAVLALMEKSKQPEYAHPFFWAPFIVAGEGGAGTTARKAAFRR